MAASAGALMQRPTRLGRAVGVPGSLPSRKDSAPPNGYVLDDVPDSMADPGGIIPKTGRLRVNIRAANAAPSPPPGFSVAPIVSPPLPSHKYGQTSGRARGLHFG